MFKTKNFITPVTIINLYFNTPTTIYTNAKSPNQVSVAYKSNGVLGPLQFLTDFDWVSAVDICALHNKFINKVTHNNIFFNYKYDLYIVSIASGRICETNSHYFFNRVWLEREVSETFNVKYFNSRDTRPLLLNYGDETGVLLNTTQVQVPAELKTHWHKRKIFKTYNINVEL